MLDRFRTRNPHWWVPWSFVAFFAVMLVANGTMLYFAVTTFNGIQPNHAYRRSQDFNKKLEAAQEQRALGWTAAIDFESARPLAGRITLSLSDRDSRPLSGADVAVTFIRPTHAGSDFSATLPAVGAGRYRLDANFPLPGQWDVRLDITHANRSFAAQERVFVKQ